MPARPARCGPPWRRRRRARCRGRRRSCRRRRPWRPRARACAAPRAARATCSARGRRARARRRGRRGRCAGARPPAGRSRRPRRPRAPRASAISSPLNSRGVWEMMIATRRTSSSWISGTNSADSTEKRSTSSGRITPERASGTCSGARLATTRATPGRAVAQHHVVVDARAADDRLAAACGPARPRTGAPGRRRRRRAAPRSARSRARQGLRAVVVACATRCSGERAVCAPGCDVDSSTGLPSLRRGSGDVSAAHGMRLIAADVSRRPGSGRRNPRTAGRPSRPAAACRWSPSPACRRGPRCRRPRRSSSRCRCRCPCRCVGRRSTRRARVARSCCRRGAVACPTVAVLRRRRLGGRPCRTAGSRRRPAAREPRMAAVSLPPQPAATRASRPAMTSALMRPGIWITPP